MLLRTLLLTVVVACAVPLCAAKWPCPDSDTIKPCTCTSDADYKLSMDCSSVQTSDTLAKVFQTHFAFNDFHHLTIHPKNSSKSLQDLPSGVFGPVSFARIDITNTRIHTVEEQALVNSHTTLAWLSLASNEISNFPFETLHLFTTLTDFDISYNKLSGDTPDIASENLITLDISGNPGLKLTETAFLQAPYIEELHLNAMQLGTTTPPSVFETLKDLKLLQLESNGITGELIENLINPQLKTLRTLSFNNNKITQIHPLAVTGMKEDGTVQFRNNKIEYLHQEKWEPLVSQLSKVNAIDVRSNPLVCGCDVMWLVYDPDLMRIFHNDTKCVTDNFLTDLPKEWFLEHCQ